MPLDLPQATAARSHALAALDPFAPEVLADPYPYLAALRSQAPCLRHEGRDLYVVTRFHDVESILMRPEVFSSSRGTGLTRVHSATEGGVIIASDRPMHQRIRRTVQPRFAMARVEALAPRLELLVDALLDRMIEAGECELVGALAQPVAAWIVNEVLGIDAGTEDLAHWSDAGFQLLGPLDRIDVARALDRYIAGHAFMSEVLDRGSHRPEGVVADIAKARDAGALSRDEAVSLALGILVAGVDTSIASLSVATTLLACHPKQWDLLRADPSLSARAFEEVLRFDGPILYWFRECVSSTEVAGVTIPKGARVMISLDSANRDASRFADPERFDIRHDAKGNLAFGRGEHLCLGAQVARLEGRVVLGCMARRLASIEVVSPPVQRKIAVIRAYDRADVRVTAA